MPIIQIYHAASALFCKHKLDCLVLLTRQALLATIDSSLANFVEQTFHFVFVA